MDDIEHDETFGDLRGVIHELAAGRIAAFKCPEALVLVDELPSTATGKIPKAEVRTLVAGAARN